MAGGFDFGRAESRCVIAAVLSAFTFGATQAHAQLTGGHVVAGQATISSPTTTSTLIQQSSQNTIINWSGFSIPTGSSVTFQQPNASSIALNRVTGGSASLIYGSLTANGRVWLINPSGVVLGPTAQVSAAGLLLSTMNIRDADFLAGNYDFSIPGDPDASIENQGRIVATGGGSVVLAAPRVRNDGLIEADLGTVVLAGAKTMTVDFAGDDLLKFAVPTAAVDSVAPGTDALVTNAGTIAAPGGRVLLTAAAAKGVLDNVINTSGIVEATSVAAVNGKIVLSATGGAAEVAGTLDASGKGAGETGGTIEVLGDAATLTATARLDASGDAGGGTVLVGGNFHGAGPEQNAQRTVVAAGAQIDASALTRGDGGRVAVWADGSTRFDGSILARGGAAGGNGGFVETSSAQGLFIGTSAHVDTRAPYGKIGTWLLDPDSIDIVADANDTTDESPAGTFTCSANGCTLTTSTIDSELANSDVTIQTSSGDITVDAQIVPFPSTFGPSLGSLSLLSANNIVLNQGIDFSQSFGNLTLSAANGAITQGSDASIVMGNTPLSMTAKTGIGTLATPIFVTTSDDCCAEFTASTQSGGVIVKSDAEFLIVGGGGIRGGTGPVLISDPTGSVVLFGDIFTQAAPVTIEGDVQVVGNQEGMFSSMGLNQTLGGSVLTDPTVDTFNGTTGANITFTSNGNISGPAPLTLIAGPSATVSVGTIGFLPSDPFSSPETISVSVNASSFSYVAIAAGSDASFSAPPSPPVVTDPNVQQQIVPHTPGTLIEFEQPPVIIGFPPPLPIFLSSSGPTLGPDSSGSGDGLLLTSVLDIDTGSQLFSQILPNFVGSFVLSPEPLTIILPITLAPQPIPPPPPAEEPLGGTGSALFQSRSFTPTLPGVPGVDEPSLGYGNPGLWFAAPGAANP